MIAKELEIPKIDVNYLLSEDYSSIIKQTTELDKAFDLLDIRVNDRNKLQEEALSGV